jgi:hypothetical protein
LLARLSSRPSSAAPTSTTLGGFTPLKYINEDPRLSRRSDTRPGGRVNKLPFDDGDA